MKNNRVLLAHGSGGKLSHELIRGLFLRRLGNPTLDQLLDAAGEDVVGRETLRLFFREADVDPDDEGRRVTRLEMLLDKRPRGNAVAV